MREWAPRDAPETLRAEGAEVRGRGPAEPRDDGIRRGRPGHNWKRMPINARQSDDNRRIHVKVQEDWPCPPPTDIRVIHPGIAEFIGQFRRIPLIGGKGGSSATASAATTPLRRQFCSGKSAPPRGHARTTHSTINARNDPDEYRENIGDTWPAGVPRRPRDRAGKANIPHSDERIPISRTYSAHHPCEVGRMSYTMEKGCAPQSGVRRQGPTSDPGIP